MIALDTNLLVAAHRRDAVDHAAAQAAIRSVAEGQSVFGLPWTCLHEFISVVTHPRVFAVPSTIEQAVAQVQAWLASPRAVTLAEAPGYERILAEILTSSRITGPRVHDARIAALCRLHGVSELWSADRDFGRFPWLTVRNPLVAKG